MVKRIANPDDGRVNRILSAVELALRTPRFEIPTANRGRSLPRACRARVPGVASRAGKKGRTGMHPNEQVLRDVDEAQMRETWRRSKASSPTT